MTLYCISQFVSGAVLCRFIWVELMFLCLIVSICLPGTYFLCLRYTRFHWYSYICAPYLNPLCWRAFSYSSAPHWGQLCSFFCLLYFFFSFTFNFSFQFSTALVVLSLWNITQLLRPLCCICNCWQHIRKTNAELWWERYMTLDYNIPGCRDGPQIWTIDREMTKSWLN